MTEIQKKMQEIISKEDLDHAFDTRFPKEMQKNYEMPELQLQVLADLDQILQLCLQEVELGKFCWWILMW